MKEGKIISQLASAVLVGLILALPVMSSLFLLNVFKKPAIKSVPQTQVPVLDEASVNLLWEEASKRELRGSSPSATINYTSLPFGRVDPFSP